MGRNYFTEGAKSAWQERYHGRPAWGSPLSDRKRESEIF